VSVRDLATAGPVCGVGDRLAHGFVLDIGDTAVLDGERDLTVVESAVWAHRAVDDDPTVGSLGADEHLARREIGEVTRFVDHTGVGQPVAVTRPECDIGSLW
jgi:hypothetical protein